MEGYTVDQRMYIERALASVSPYTRHFLPFNDEPAFMKTTRMSVLRFLQLVDILKHHRLFVTDDMRDVAFQIAFTMFRLGSTGSIRRAAEQFNMPPDHGRKYTGRVVQAVVDTFWHLITFPESAPSQSTHQYRDRVGYLGAGNVWLLYKPEYQRELFLCRDEGSEGNPGIRVLAAVSDECRFLYFSAECPASFTYKEAMCASPLVQNQSNFLKDTMYLLTDNAPKECAGIIWPYLESNYTPEIPHDQISRYMRYPSHASAILAVGRTFSMWKQVFPSLLQLPLIIRSQPGFQNCKLWIQATVCLYNYLQPNTQYAQRLRQLDSMYS